MGEKIKKLIGVQGDFKTTILPMINYSYANMYMGGAGVYHQYVLHCFSYRRCKHFT